MARDRFSKIPAELRLKIFGYLLSFDSPLKPAKTNPEAPRIDNAILAVSTQIHEEAEDVLYGLNTFSLTFPELHYADDGKVRANPLAAHAYRSMEIVVDHSMRSCNVRRLVAMLKKASTCAANTELKSITVQLKNNYPGFATEGGCLGLEDSLTAAGMMMQFTDMACVEVSSHDEVLAASSPRIRIEWPSIIKGWRFYSALPITSIYLGFPPGGPGSLGDGTESLSEDCSRPVAVGDLVKTFYRRQADLLADKKQQSGQSEDGKLCCEAEHTAEWLEKDAATNASPGCCRQGLGESLNDIHKFYPWFLLEMIGVMSTFYSGQTSTTVPGKLRSDEPEVEQLCSEAEHTTEWLKEATEKAWLGSGSYL